MLLAIDVGNTNTVFALLSDDKINNVARINTDVKRMQTEYEMLLYSIFELRKLSFTDITGCIISSVVPPVTYQIKTAIKALTGVLPIVVSPSIKTDIEIRIDEPSTLGSDMLTIAVAAKVLYPLPAIVLDLGTATKVIAVSQDGAFLGGVIAPGIGISMETLSKSTAALPLISAARVHKAIGTNTIDCMRGGVILGTACMLDGMIDHFVEELTLPTSPCKFKENETPTIVGTGGYCTLIAPYCKHKFVINGNLIMQGMGIIYRQNVPKIET